MEKPLDILLLLTNFIFKKSYFIFFILLYFTQIPQLNGDCSTSNPIKDGDSCFNRIIRIKGRGGQFTVRKDGSLFIEYSSGAKRRFFGIKKNGRGAFPNEETITEFEITKAKNKIGNDVDTRYESKNALVRLINDDTQTNQYIFSVSTYFALAELHFFDEDGNNRHKTWTTTDFFNINDDARYVFSYQFSLIDGGSNIYYAAYVQYKGTYSDTEKDYSVSYTLSKFKFTDANTREIIKGPKEFTDNYDNRIVCSFVFTHFNCLSVFFVKSDTLQYTMRWHDLETLESKKTKEFYGIASHEKGFPGEGIFFKAHYLWYQFFTFLFYTDKDNNQGLKLRIYKVDENDDHNIKKINGNDFGYNLDTSIRLNEFYKIDQDHLLIVSSHSTTKLYLMFIDTYDWYKYMNVRSYFYDIQDYYLREEIAVEYYNEFLMFTASVSKNGESGLSSILLFFSYPNGTDFYMNISPYVNNSGYYSGDNLISYLLSTRKIENNIFGYSPIEEIKLISIPDEILFYRKNNKTSLINGERISPEHTLNENKTLIKYDRNYTLDYQFMVIGKPDYWSLYNSAPNRQDKIKDSNCHDCNSYDATYGYTQKTYFGRTNRLTFRLCHDYCETCKELGNSNDNQKCITCLPEYKYDYFNYFNIYPENCVPEGYFNDLGTNKRLVECNPSNSKFYYNKTDNNKKICFDKQKECPDTYSFLNITTNECLNFSFPTTIITTIPAIPPTTILIPPTTIPIPPTTILIPPTTIPIPPTTVLVPPTTIPVPITTLLITPTTILVPPTTFPNLPTTTPIPPTTIPTLPTTIPIPPTTIQPVQTTILVTPTTITAAQTTIINIIPTTIPNIKTTIPTPVPSTIPLIITTNVQSTIPKIMPEPKTTVVASNPSTIINKPPTTLPKFISPTTNMNILTTNPKIFQSTIYQDKCLNGTYITNLCSNISDEELYSRLREEIFDAYDSDKAAKLFSGKGDYSLRISNTKNEMKGLNSSNGLTLIDLGECENLLKKKYNIPLDAELIILKKEKINSEPNDKDIDYEIFDPFSYEKLNMSICENTHIDLYVPLQLTEEEEKFYKEISEQGYDIFDLGDKFYREICTPYNSENGTDVLLDDREEFFYYPIAEKMVCQNNCEYSSYSLDTKYMKCECGNGNHLVTLDIKHLSKENVLQSFLSTLKSTNYKVMRCYNLVFNLKIFVKNYGSIITLLFFVVYVVFMIIYIQKEINPLKVEISKFLFDNKNKEEMVKYNKFGVSLYQKIKMTEKENPKIRKNTKKKGNFPPKKQITKKSAQVYSTGKARKTSENSNIDIMGKSSRTNLKKKTTNLPKKTTKSEKDSSKRNKNNKQSMDKFNESDEEELQKNKSLDNFELNNLDYDEACELDKRGLCKTYWSVLLREHIFIFTFFTFYDYNLFYIKIERFLTLVCVEMTVNGLFFVHESMHRKYVNGEELTFVQKIPQLLFTLIASHIIEVILCFMGMTDVHVYQIKEISKIEKSREKIIDIIDKIKRKLVWFFVFTFLLFLFNWYFISAFCAVYQNTQKIFLRDSAISFLTSMIDPFIIYGVTSLLRFISLLACCKKKLGCIYKLSDLIPIF